MAVSTRVIRTKIGEVRRIALPASVVEAAHARPGSGLIVDIVGDGVIEMRVRPERTMEEILRDFALTVPIDDLEVSLREEEQRLADEFR